MAKIGILGGTFDPIHNGHLALGKQAYEQFKLDEIWFMPSGHPPHKKSRLVTARKRTGRYGKAGNCVSFLFCIFRF